MIVRGAFNHLLRPGLRSDFRDSYDSFEEEYSRILRVGTQDRAEVEATTISGLPRMVIRGEGESFVFIDPKLADKLTYTDEEYGLGFIISKRMMEDDLYAKANQGSKWLGRSVRLTQEYACSDLLDDAFAGASFTGYAAEPLIDTAHTLLSSANTWSNQVSGDPELGIAGLQAAQELGEQIVDQNGYPIPTRVDTLIVNIADEHAAIQLTQNEMEPFTANRNINTTLKKRKMSYVVSHYKDQTGSDWFARDTQLHDAHFLFRIRPEFLDWMDMDTQSAKYAARQRINVYFYDQRGWIGSNAA